MLKLYQRIFEEFRKVKGKGKIIVFGSVVKGKSKFDSDIDIAVITDDKKFLSKVEKLSDEILFKYGKVVSLIKFSEKEFETGKEPIIKEIKKGMIIYGGS
jgi:predicted nucleotidyltransferase